MSDDIAASGAGRLTGSVAVVTGSSTGNGRAIALELAAEGAQVVCSDLNKSLHPDAADVDEHPTVDTDELILSRGGEAAFLNADVSSEADMEALADFAVESFGRLDAWVNNAGTAAQGPVVEHTLADFQRCLDVNLIGTFLGIRAAVRIFRTRERTGRSLGRIVNLGSIAAEIGQGQLSGYVASKGAVHALTRELAIELAPEHINVNAIAPGYFNTTAMNRVVRDSAEFTAAVEAKHPWPEMAPSSDLGRAVVYLVSDDAAWITGSILPVDGGVLAS